MFVLIDKVNFENKGAELMLYAIEDKLKEHFKKDINVVLTCEIPVNKKKYFRIAPKSWEFLGSFILSKLGYVKLKDITLVLNAAGFYFSDQWIWVKDYYDEDVHHYVLNQKTYFSLLKKYGAKQILLPQAFGPFKKIQALRTIKAVFPYFDLVFIRDDSSCQYLIEAVGKHENIQHAPDFTSLYKPPVFEKFKNIAEGAIVIIANSKMLINVKKNEANNYFPFMVKLIKWALATQRNVLLLNHEGKRDENLIMDLYRTCKVEGDKLHMYPNLDAPTLKYIIGLAYIVFSSRYHGVISALSQEVPTLCVGWSHKYQSVFNDYKFAEGYLDTCDEGLLLKQLDYVFDAKNNQKIRAHLKKQAEVQKQLTEQMWQKVFDIFYK